MVLNNTTVSADRRAVDDRPPPDLILDLLLRKWIVLIAIILCAGLAWFLAAFMDRAWRSELQLAVVKQDDESGALSGLGSQLGGISALAGISTPADEAKSEYIATLKSDGLARAFFHDASAATEFCRAKLFKCTDPSTWKDGPPETVLYKISHTFRRTVLEVDEDKLSGLIRVSVTWVDRVVAAQWANGIVAEANRRIQQRAETEAHSRLDYLREEVQSTDLIPLRDAASRLMESQVRTEMMARTRPEYAFRVIDEARPSAASDFVKPRRAIMAAAGGALGFLAIALWTIIRPPRPR